MMMINGYAQSGRPEESLALFREVEAAGIEPDAAIIVRVISWHHRSSSAAWN
jgi:pentatricopeptide repeat protein